MTTTARQLLREALPKPRKMQGEAAPSRSKKDWVMTYLPVPVEYDYEPTMEDINNMFGEETREDQERLGLRVHQINRVRDIICTERDVAMLWHTQVTSAVRLPYESSGYEIRHMLEREPLEGSDRIYVDECFTWASGDAEFVVAIGEFKSWGAIRPDEWRGSVQQTQYTMNLGRELRAYAYKYRSRLIYCFDGLFLLIVFFDAQERSKIREASCEVRSMLIPCESGETPDQCSVRYAMFKTLTVGIRLIEARGPLQ